MLLNREGKESFDTKSEVENVSVLLCVKSILYCVEIPGPSATISDERKPASPDAGV